jgi:FkbH-like protein
MSPLDPKPHIQYQHLITLQPGYRLEKIPAADIARVLDLAAPFNATIIPDEVEGGTALYFGLIDFAFDTDMASTAERKVKCVVWDLDNTLWDGTLIEDGLNRLRVKSGLADVIKMLDDRGIINSVASKNNPEDALAALTYFGLVDYILSPQISWNPKSAGVQAVARNLNIGLESILFVDDSPFERAEVTLALPGVRVEDASRALEIPRRTDCDVPATEESRKRRALYREASVRDSEAAKFDGDYMAFLKDCALELNITPLQEANLTRAHELTQRTNQMNFSGNRYSREVLEALLRSDDVLAYVMDCRDRFGHYGTVGFCVVDRHEPRVTDLAFSCRVQSKRVEHAFLTWLLNELISSTGHDCYFNYRKTSRNEQAGKVFDDFGMEVVEVRDGVTSLVFSASRSVPNDHLIRTTGPTRVTEIGKA